jgi:hypothetical protein
MESTMFIRIANLTVFTGLATYYDPIIGALVWLVLVAVEKTVAAVLGW